MAVNLLLQLGVALPGLGGNWYTAPKPGMDCMNLCYKLGGSFDAEAAQHNGTIAGSYFHPMSENQLFGAASAVECSNDTFNFGANGARPTGREVREDCHVHCPCTGVPEPELQINFEPWGYPESDWLGDGGNPFGARPTCMECSSDPFVRFGWQCGKTNDATVGVYLERTEPVDMRARMTEGEYLSYYGYDGQSGLPQRTGVVPDSSGACPSEAWNFEVPTGFYQLEVMVQRFDQDINVSGCTVEGSPLGLDIIVAGEDGMATVNVSVADGNLTFAGSAQDRCEFINWMRVKRLAARSQKKVVLSGDYNVLHEEREEFLAACSSALAPVSCDDMEQGSVVLTLGLDDNDAFLDGVAEDVESGGLQLEGFPSLLPLTTSTTSTAPSPGACAGLNPDDLLHYEGGQCAEAADHLERCQVYLNRTRGKTCSEWCNSQGRTALTEGWQCDGGWESYFNRPGESEESRRLRGSRALSEMDYAQEAQCFQGFELGCDQPSDYDHLICQCKDASPVFAVEDLADDALQHLLANFSNVSGTSVTIVNETATVTAIVLTAEAAEAAGGSLKVEIANMAAAVEVPASAISTYGEAIILVIAAYSSGTVNTSESLLDSSESVIPDLGWPVSARFATTSGRYIIVENLEDPISITVPLPNISGMAWDCGFFNENTARWTTDNVDLEETGSEFLVCRTRHLTLFAAIGNTFVEVLRCSNAFLLSVDGVKMIPQGSWAYEPAAIFLWLVCLFHIMLCVGAARFDWRARQGGLWTDEDFFCDMDYLYIPEEGEYKLAKVEAPAMEKSTNRLKRSLKEMPRRGEFRLWLRAQVNAYCIKQIVAYRMWISPGDMRSLLAWFGEKTSNNSVTPVITLSPAAAEEPPSKAPTLMGILRSQAPSTRVLSPSRSPTASTDVTSERAETPPHPAAVSACEGNARAETAARAAQTGKKPVLAGGAAREARSKPLCFGSCWLASRDASGSGEFGDDCMELRIDADALPVEPPAQDPGVQAASADAAVAPPAIREDTVAKAAETPGSSGTCCVATPAQEEPEPPTKSTSLFERLAMRQRTGQSRQADVESGVSGTDARNGSKGSSTTLRDSNKAEPVMKSLAKPLQEELEKHHEEYFALRSTHRYAAGILCFGMQPWLSLYRYSIFQSCKVRALHLTAEVFGALMFSALFFGFDATSVNAPDGCDAENWADELWSELAAGILGFLFALLPVFILKFLGRREFMEVADRQTMEAQLLAWKIQDTALWILGTSYIAFCLFFIITFLANTKVNTGLSFVGASVVEELMLNMFVPISIAVAYLVLDLTMERGEEDYIMTKRFVGLHESERPEVPLSTDVTKSGVSL